MKKRLLPALLALVMVLGMFPLTVFAVGEDTGAEGNTDAKTVSVTIGMNTTQLENDKTTFTAQGTEVVTLGLVQSGEGPGTTAKMVGYWVKIDGITAPENGYILRSRDVDLSKVTSDQLNELKNKLESENTGYASNGKSLAEYMELVSAAAWKKDESPYWVEIGRRPTVHIAKVTAKEDGSLEVNTDSVYTFDFTAIQIKLPFSVEAAEITGKDYGNFECDTTKSVAIDLTGDGANGRTAVVTGNAKEVDGKYYVALKIAGAEIDGKTPSQVVAVENDILKDGVLLKEITKDTKNTKIELRVHYNEGNATNYRFFLDVSGVKLGEEDSGDDTNPTTTIPALKADKMNEAEVTQYQAALMGTDKLTVAGLGDFTIGEATGGSPTAKTIKVTGSANYVEWSAFNSAESGENKGHYLPLCLFLDGKEAGETTYPVTVTTGNMVPSKEYNWKLTRDEGIITAVYLDKLMGEKGAKNFTVKVGTGDNAVTYTFDCEELVLIPEHSENVKPEVNQPEEGSNEAPTVTFKNETLNASITVPVNADTIKATVDVKKEDSSAVDTIVTAATVDAKVEEGTKAALTAALKNANAVTYTVKDEDGENIFAESQEGVTLTITLDFQDAGTYYVFCVRDNATKDLTCWGKYRVTEGQTLTLTTPHLSTAFWMPEPTDEATKAKLDDAASKLREKDVKAIGDDVEDLTPGEQEKSDIALSYTPKNVLKGDDAKQFYGGKLEISNLTPEKWYVVTFDYGGVVGGQVPRAALALQADKDGKIAVSCQSSMKVTVQATGEDNDVNAATLSAIFYDPIFKNQGVLVTDFRYITQITSSN